MKKILIPSLALTAPLHASVLSHYTFAGNSFASSDTHLTSTSSDYTLYSSGTQDINGERVRISSDSTNSSGQTTTPLSNRAHHSFTLTAAPGQEITLDNLTLAYSFQNTFDDPVLAPGLQAYFDAFVSTDGFATHTYLGGAMVDGNNYTNGSTTADFNLDFTLPAGTTGTNPGAYAEGTTLEFRLYFTDNSTAGTRYHRVDSIIVNGETIPEPSGTALFGLALSFSLLKRRR
ncbi:MAG: PEP-CTERM sorting domain-containing protein [Verrucomicrobiales bacterium]